MNSLIKLKKAASLRLITFTLLFVCFGLLPRAQAVVPPPDGGYPGFNTAEGQSALFSLTTGTNNTAVGWASLGFNLEGDNNTAIGAAALLYNTGEQNTAVGAGALLNNITSFLNVAVGSFTLFHNVASGNTAVGAHALFRNTSGIHNTAVGEYAGVYVTGSGNVCIGAVEYGNANVDNTTWIKNVYDSQATARAVYVNANNKIGTLSSSRRYKEDITPMDQASEVLYRLKPVTFRYKKEIDRTHALSFGLIAEEAAGISPDLITRDRDGKPETVRYEAVNAMLLNEFLKAHGKVEKLEVAVAQQQKQIEALTTGLQKVSAQLAAASPSRGGLEAGKFATGRICRGGPTPQVVNNP
jgi:hypothetical protein